MAKYEDKGLELSENIWADVFDKDEKELYFALTFNFNSSGGRNVIAYWDVSQSEEQVRLLKSALNQFHKMTPKSQKDEYDEYTIHDKKSGRTAQLCVSKDHEHLYPLIEVNVGSSISIQVPEVDVDKIISERSRTIEHAKIEKLASGEVVPFADYLEPLRTEMLISVSDVQEIINVIDQATKSESTEDRRFDHKEWCVHYKAQTLCEKCKDHDVEERFFLSKDSSSIETAFVKEEINELSWACKRLLQKHSNEISKLKRSEN